MTLVLRTTDRTAEPAPVLPTLPAGTDPLLQLEYEMQQPSGPGATRCLSHPAELALRGIPVRCSACRARIDALIAVPDRRTYPSLEEGLAALGFDGAFAGTYLD